jgi:8-oxo-dGTP pyrophosphatase MutT (NUDIX family)
MREETGVDLETTLQLIGIDHRVDVGGTGPVLDCHFYGGTLDESTALRLSPEHDDHGFFGLGELHEVLEPSHARTVRALHAAATAERAVCLRGGRML